ncbi:hypothetical protein AAG906_021490 [Vitis piasezkii]
MASMAQHIELQPCVDAVETGAVAAILQHLENVVAVTGDRRNWFSYRLGVEEDGDENKEAAAILSLRSLMVVSTTMVLMLMLALSALEVPISRIETMDKCLIFGWMQAWRMSSRWFDMVMGSVGG